MKKIFALLIVVLIIFSATPFTVYADGCEGRKFIPERVPAKCSQQTTQNEGVSQEDKDERHRVNVLYHPYVELYPYMDTGW